MTRTLMAAGAVVVVAVLAGACRSEQPAPVAPPATASDIEWRTVGHWSGRGNRQTESFEVSMSAMRLRWRTTNETAPGAGRLTVTLHSAVSGRPLQTILETHGVGDASVDVAEEPRWCHFTIEAAGLDYEMTLEQGFARQTR